MRTKELLTRFWFAFLRVFGLDSCPVEPPPPSPSAPSPGEERRKTEEADKG